jgi:predicted transcriptional regulator
MNTEDNTINAVELATELTMAWLSNPNTRVTAEEVPIFLKSMHDQVGSLFGAPTTDEAGTVAAPAQVEGVVSVRKSLASKDVILSMIDGKPYRTLKRHIATNGMTPAQYRERFGLKPDYPMVAESYSEARRIMAKKIGLGRKPAPVEEAPAEVQSATTETAPAKPKRGRPAKKVG